MKNQKGFTVVELVIAICFIATFTVLCTLGYIGAHFLAKFW